MKQITGSTPTTMCIEPTDRLPKPYELWIPAHAALHLFQPFIVKRRATIFIKIRCTPFLLGYVIVIQPLFFILKDAHAVSTVI